MFSGCATSSGNTQTPIVALVPPEYLAGCTPFSPTLTVGGLSKTNATRLATAFRKCSALQVDETAWIVSYLNSLGGRRAR